MYDKVSCWLQYVFDNFVIGDELEGFDELGRVRTCLVGGWIVGYVEFPEPKTRRQAGFLLKMNRRYLFGGRPQRYSQVKGLFEGRRELLSMEYYTMMFEDELDELYDGIYQIVQENGGVNNLVCQEFVLDFERDLGLVPYIPSKA